MRDEPTRDRDPAVAETVTASAASRRAELVQQLRALITREQLGPGEHLGTERTLAERFGVGRSALRGALEVLEAAGEVRRTMGRLGGVSVSDGKITRHVNTIQGVPQMLRQQGVEHLSHVLRAEVGTPTRQEQRLLRLEAPGMVVRLSRRRDAAGVPLSLDTMSLPAALVPGWARHDFSQSAYLILREEYGIEPAHATESIEVSLATEAQAAILEIGVGAPLLEIRRLTVDRDHRPIELSCDLFRADRTRISMERTGQSWKRVARSKR